MQALRKLFGFMGKSNQAAVKVGKKGKQTKKKSAGMYKILSYGFMAWWAYMTFRQLFPNKLLFSFSPTLENRKLIEASQPLKKGRFDPTFWMPFGIMQWYYARFFGKQPYLYLQKQEQLPGYELHWLPLNEKMNNRKQQSSIAVILNGSSGFDYMSKCIVDSCYMADFKVISITPDNFHNVKELNSVLEHIQKQYPSDKIYGIGIEYGANLLINYSATYPEVFSGLVSIGNPLDLAESELKLDSSWLWKGLAKKTLKSRSRTLQNAVPQNIYTIDKYLQTIPNDSDLLKWKKANSSLYRIKELQARTLFIQSQEDPFSIKLEDNENIQNQLCIFVETEKGGHNQWYESMYALPWVKRPAVLFIKLLDSDILKQQAQTKQ